jgi:hypothetical protein
MEDHDDFAFEPIPGLPAELPKGEILLWQGSPSWRALARSAFHVRKVAVYFALILAWQLATAAGAGASIQAMAASSTWLVAVAAVAIGILTLLAWLYARGTIYTLTTKRLIVRSGLALPVTLNLPLSLIDTAQVARSGSGPGSIILKVAKPNRVAFLVLWPNARPWRFNNPQPMLRCLDDVDAVAPLIAKALEADAGMAPAPAPLRATGKTVGAAPLPAGAGLAAA